MVCLGEDDEVENMIQSAVATPVQAVPHLPGRRRFQWRYAGVGGELGVGLEAVAWSQDGCEPAGSEEVDSTELCEQLEPSLRKFADLTSELRLMRKSQRKTAREAAYDESALLLQRTLGRRRVALEGLQTCLGVHRREVEIVLGIELEK